MPDYLIEKGKLKEYSGTDEKVVVPDGVTAIGENAFWNSDISAIELPTGLKKIEEGAFLGCRKLKRIAIPETVTSIGPDAFGGCGIEQLVLPPKLTRISDDAFADSKLEEITIPEAVKTIGRQAFCGCRQLKKVILPANLKRIESGAFRNCTALTEINLPPRVQLEGGAFDGCTHFMDDDGFIVINGALYNCPGIYKSYTVKLPEGIRVIKSWSIDIRRDLDGVIWAYDRAELRRAREEKVGSIIEIPTSVERYESFAFMGDIEEIISHSTASFYCHVLGGCTKLKKLTVPEGTEVSENVFGFNDKDIAHFKKLIICYSDKNASNSIKAEAEEKASYEEEERRYEFARREWKKECEIIKAKRSVYVTEKYSKTKQAITEAAVARRDEAISKANEAIKEQEEIKAAAESALATLGLFRFIKKRKQKAIIEKTSALLAEAKATAAAAESAYRTEIQNVDAVVRKQLDQFSAEADCKYPLPEAPKNPLL